MFFVGLRFDGFFFDANATPRGPRHLGLGREGIGGGDGAEDQEQNGIGGDVEVEVDETVEKQTGDSGDGGGVDGSGEVALFGFVRSASVAKQDGEESEAAESADDAKFGQEFDVVVVNVVNEMAVVVGLEFRIGGDEGTETGAADGIGEEEIEAAAGHRDAAGYRDFARTKDGEALDDSSGAEPGDEGEGCEDDEADGNGPLATARLARTGEKAEDGEFEYKADDAGTRAGKDQRADRDDAKKRGERKNVATHSAKNHESERKWERHFDEAGEVVAVDVRAEDGAADGEFAEPVDGAFRGEVLRDAEERDGEA